MNPGSGPNASPQVINSDLDLKLKFVSMTGEGVGGGAMQPSTLGALALSVVSAVAIVICNKALITNLGFNFATTLSSWHLVITYASLHLANSLNFFQQKSVNIQVVMTFGILNASAIAFLNLSLCYNSVGFYQMTKLAIIPCTVLLETVFLNKNFSRRIQLSLVLLLSGVAVATITDMELNFQGTVLSLFAIMTTCIAQIMTNTIQKSYKVSSTQLLFQSCPYQVITLIFMGPFFDFLLTKQNVFAFTYSFKVMVFIVLSCLIAVFVNFSTFLVIGKTSPVSYQVLGHLKTCLILTFGYAVLRTPFNSRNVSGIAVALIGMGVYSYSCILESQQKNSSSSSNPIIQAQMLHKDEALIVIDNGRQNIAEDATIIASSLWQTDSLANKET